MWTRGSWVFWLIQFVNVLKWMLGSSVGTASWCTTMSVPPRCGAGPAWSANEAVSTPKVAITAALIADRVVLISHPLCSRGIDTVRRDRPPRDVDGYDFPERLHVRQWITSQDHNVPGGPVLQATEV